MPPDDILAEMRADIKILVSDVATIKGQLEGKLHEPASCELRDKVADLQVTVSNSKSFLAGILFLAGFLGSGITLGASILIQWLKG